MAQKPKAGGAKKKAPQKRMTPKEQRERFIQTARQIGVDESGAEFEALFGRVASPRNKLRSDKGRRQY
jgi:hypothetical protein